MYKLVGKQTLEAVNDIAQTCLILKHNLTTLPENQDSLNISIDQIDLLINGYLLLYSTVLEHSLMPSSTQPKFLNEVLH